MSRSDPWTLKEIIAAILMITFLANGIILLYIDQYGGG